MSILFLIILVAAAVLFRLAMLRRGLKDITYDLALSTLTAEPGEEFEIVTTVENKGRLPVLFLGISEQLPYDITVNAGKKSIQLLQISRPDARFSKLEQTTYVMPRQRLTRRVTASLPARGHYTISSVTLTGGDILGLSQFTQHETIYREAVIYPVSAKTPELVQVFGNFLGDVSVRRFILEDPVLTLGFREYSGREPMKNISWPRSLRDNQLMVKQFDYTMELTATILLNVDRDGEVPEEAVEKVFSIARALCEDLEERHITYGFSTNAAAAGRSGYWSTVGEGMGDRHLRSILEGLGRAIASPTESLARMLGRIGHGTDQGRAYVLITPGIPESALPALQDARRRLGGSLFIIDSTKEA